MNGQDDGTYPVSVEHPAEHAPPSVQDLHRYVDGQLDSAESAQIAAYLASHPEQAAAVAAYRAQNAGLHALYDGALNEPIPRAMLGLVRYQRSRRIARIIILAAMILALGALSGAAGWWAHDLVHAERPKR